MPPVSARSSISSRTSTSAKTSGRCTGFPSQDELELFELLLGVSGVGARTALAVLGAASPEQLRSAIAHEQTEVLTRVPGIGPKTAKSIVFHLKDKVGIVTAGAQIAYLTDADTEVIAALTGLGYSIVEAQTALASLPRDASQDVEDRHPVGVELLCEVKSEE